jgi:hypothetical protein
VPLRVWVSEQAKHLKKGWRQEARASASHLDVRTHQWQRTVRILKKHSAREDRQEFWTVTKPR